MGVAFPIGLHVWTSGLAARGRAAARIGLFYSLNVMGAIVGSLVAGSCSCRGSAAGPR